MVQQIEVLGAELQTRLFAEEELFGDHEIYLSVADAADNVAASCAEGAKFSIAERGLVEITAPARYRR